MTEVEVCIAFYRWALEDAEREVESDFAFFRRFAEGSSYRFLSIAQQLGRKDRAALLRALTKRYHRRAMELSGDELSATDADWIERYLRRDAISALGPAHYLRASAFEDGTAVPLSRQYFGKLLKPSGLPLSVPQLVSYKVNLFYVQIEHQSCCIETVIDIGGRSRQASFGHSIIAANGKVILYNIDPLTWFGISSCQWLQVPQSEAPMIVETITCSVKRVMSLVECFAMSSGTSA